MNNDNFLIEEKDLEQAQDICKDIEDTSTRNRAMSNALASEIAIKYFQEIEVDTESGLHKIPQVLSDIDIADIYLNGSYVDVRVYFNDNELCVPKKHFERDLIPLAYMFIKLDTDLSGGLVTGFILPSSIDKTFAQDEYYIVNENSLISYYDIEPLLITKEIPEPPQNIENLIYDYLDDKLNYENKNLLYKFLLESSDYRVLLKKAGITKKIFNFVSLAKTETSEQLTSLTEESTNELLVNDDDNESMAFDVLSDDSSDEISEDLVKYSENNELILEHNGDGDLFNNLEELDNQILENAEDNIISDSLEEDNLLEDTSLVEELNIQDSDITNLDEYEELPNFGEETELNEEQITESSISESLEEPSIEALSVDDNQEENQEEDLTSNYNDFSTTTTPSLENIEELDFVEEEDVVEDDDLSTLLEAEETINSDKFEPIESVEEEEEEEEEEENTIAEGNIIEENENSEIIENPENSSIENLYPEENNNPETFEDNFVMPSNKKASPLLPIIGTLAIIIAIGYFGYTKFVNSSNNSEAQTTDTIETVQQPTTQPEIPLPEAMPIETVENIKTELPSNEGSAVSIPAIEQNLNTSIMVSNLSVIWEVPVGYVSNTTAKRYFTKIGKIIQLNLKTELLLLSKQPITNKIGLELEFNKNLNKFVVKNITASSGEKVIDDLIQKTVKNALDLNLKINMNTFTNITGNPVLIIRL